MIDLLIKKAHLVNGDVKDIAVKDGKILKIADEINEVASEILEVPQDYLVSAGWIDDHLHCFEDMHLYYDYPDEVGYKMGVTSVIDAGTTGAINIGTLKKLADDCVTNVFALVNISKFGIVDQNELEDMTKIDHELIKQVVKAYPNFIVGLKARMSRTVVGPNGVEPLKIAKVIQNELGGMPLMVHIGSEPPVLDDVIDVLDKGDVVTHCFNGKKNGIYDSEKKEIKPIARKMKEKGIIFDIGHGTDSFNFEVAERAFEAGVVADTISTDLYIRNRKNGPVFSFATTLEKMLVVGYSLEDIIAKVTEVPAKIFNLKNKGLIKEGYDADFTVFSIHKGIKALADSNGNLRLTRKVIQPEKVIVSGKVYQINKW